MVDFSRGLPAAFLNDSGSSFADLLARHAPEALSGEPGALPGKLGKLDAPHGTTVLAMVIEGGVLMAGDRRATAGNVIAQRDLEKVCFADEFSAVAFAGTVGVATELVRLFQFELEHYQKMQGRELSVEGKARRLGSLVQGNLAQAMQGLAAIPLLAVYDQAGDAGRIFSYDVTGAPAEVSDFHADGSGSPYARGTLKKLYRPGFSVEDAATAAIQALYDAAEEDSATGGPDLTRKIYPSMIAVTADGYRRLPEAEIRAVAEAVVEGRHDAPNGPAAPLR